MIECSFGDWQSDKFQQCCKDSGVTCLNICKFPPENSWWDVSTNICTAKYINEFIHCYTNNQNNREKCKAVGMPPKCLDLCDGTQVYWADPGYLSCHLIGYRISKVNHDNMINN